MRVEVEKEVKNDLLQKNPWMGQKFLWMRVEVEKEVNNGLLQKDHWMGHKSLWMTLEWGNNPFEWR